MNDIPYVNYSSMSDKALAEHIGAFIRHHRLEQNRTQVSLAEAAGLSRSTLSLLENGETVTTATLIQVLRILDRLDVMNAFVVNTRPSPLAMAKFYRELRQRARQKQINPSKKHHGKTS